MMVEATSATAPLLDGRYILTDRVGTGGMATVYRAEDTRLGRIVAIKMIHGGESMLGSADRAHTEKALLAALSHPSLVTLFDAHLDPGGPQYLVMEYVDGPTLADRMAVGPIPPPHLARIARDLADGLDAAHAAGIVHRDVKPSNVLMARTSSRDGGRWAAKLADFGIAFSLDGSSRLTTPGTVLGTLTYMAPEQVTDAEPGTAVDVFALGLVVLEALTGEPGYPTTGSGRAAAMARLTQPPTIPERVDADWRDLIERMTRLEPGERPSAAEVAQSARALAGRIGPVSAVAPLFPPGAGIRVQPLDAADPGLATAGLAATVAADPPTAKTVALPADETVALPNGERAGVAYPGAPARSRRQLILIAVGTVVAVGALATSASALMAPTAADLGRQAAGAIVRPVETPVETEPDPVVPAETVPDEGNPGKGEEKKAENAGKPGGDKGKGK